MHYLKKHMVRFIRKYDKLPDEQRTATQKLIEFLINKNWIYNIRGNYLQEDNLNIIIKTKLFEIYVLFEYYASLNYPTIFMSANGRMDKAKYAPIQCPFTYKDNLDTFLRIIDKLESDKSYYQLLQNQEYPFEEGYIYEPDNKFKFPKDYIK